jgi:MipA family protein
MFTSYAMRSVSAAVFSVGAALLTSPPASAQAFDVVRLYGASSDSDKGMIGAAVIAGRQYQGSDERRTLVLPVFDYQWTSGWFAGTSNGLGYDFSRRPDMNYGVRVTADLGRKESRSSALRGMGDVDVRPEIGAFYNYAVSREFALTSSLRYGAGNERNGMLVDLGAAYAFALTPQWRLGVGVAATYANAQYLQSYFGVTPSQAARSAYSAYTPSAGVRDVRANAALTYSWNPQWSVTTALSASALQGDAKSSPLTRQSSSVTGVVGVAYRF